MGKGMKSLLLVFLVMFLVVGFVPRGMGMAWATETVDLENTELEEGSGKGEVTLNCIEVMPVICGFTLDPTSLPPAGGTVVASVTGKNFPVFCGKWAVSLDGGTTKIGAISNRTKTSVTITFDVPANTDEDPRDYTITLWLNNAMVGPSCTIIVAGSEPELPSITGVTINGIAKFGHTLSASVTYSASPEPTPALTYQWKRDGQNISGATSSSYTLQEADIGACISVNVTASGTATGDKSSIDTLAVQKADGPIAPPTPTLDSKTSNSVTLTANSAHQFSRDGGSNWQDDNIFTGLSSSTEYTFVARVKETATHKASVAGNGLNVTTNAAPRSGGGGGIARLNIRIGSLLDGIAGMDYSHTFKASGGRLPYSFRVTEGTLPDGMNLAEGGVLKGKPVTYGTYKFTVTVSDLSHTTSRHTFTWVVKEGDPADVSPQIILTVDSLLASVNGQLYTLEVAPFIVTETNRTMVPIRFISEALKAHVDWNSVTRQVMIKDGDQEIILTVGSNKVMVNRIEERIDCAPVILSPGRTFVPLRFVCEILGATVEYNNVNKMINIRR